MLELLKKQVCDANLELVKHGLVVLTWGNASGIDRENNLIVIKPSGVPYDGMRPEHMVVVDMDGNKVEGRYNPSVDTPAHLAPSQGRQSPSRRNSMALSRPHIGG